LSKVIRRHVPVRDGKKVGSGTAVAGLVRLSSHLKTIQPISFYHFGVEQSLPKGETNF
jgi:hypothetical protein